MAGWTDWSKLEARILGLYDEGHEHEPGGACRACAAIMGVSSPPKDPNYPGICPRCGGPAYVGATSVDCKGKCT
jgi:hypothetical protein